VQSSLQYAIQSFMHLKIEIEHEDDGRWIAEIPQLPGVLAYGATPDEASARAEILALRVLAERLEHGEAKPVEIIISLAAA
jgi:predicted RNase H-like HicB family nuclease